MLECRTEDGGSFLTERNPLYEQGLWFALVAGVVTVLLLLPWTRIVRRLRRTSEIRVEAG
ncbi:MAG TPA: hypothetical protein DHV14_13495 [Micrococcales bacterium]|nr:hypothetical protein [Micrococcales bacterium]